MGHTLMATAPPTIVKIPLPIDVLREIDEGAKAGRQSREEFLSNLANNQYASERRWQRIQAVVSSRVEELGLTEDDIEGLGRVFNGRIAGGDGPCSAPGSRRRDTKIANRA